MIQLFKHGLNAGGGGARITALWRWAKKHVVIERCHSSQLHLRGSRDDYTATDNILCVFHALLFLWDTHDFSFTEESNGIFV